MSAEKQVDERSQSGFLFGITCSNGSFTGPCMHTHTHTKSQFWCHADPKSYNLKALAEEMTVAACILEKFGMCKMQESMTQENLGAKFSSRIQCDSGLKTYHTRRSGRHRSIYIGLCFV